MTEAKDKGISIVGITVKDFQRLRAAELKFTKTGMKRITGLNAQGKSALLKAIKTAFTGKAAGGVVPINTDSEDGKAEVELHLDNGFQIRRTWTEKGSYLTVIGPDGGKHTQTRVNEWLTPYGFDPLQFFTLKADKQREILLSLSTNPRLPKMLGDLDDKFDAIKAERTQYEAAKMRLTKLEPPQGERPELLDVSTTAQILSAKMEEQKKHEAVDSKVRDDESEIGRIDSAIATLKSEMKELKDRLEKGSTMLTAAKKELTISKSALAACPDVSKEIDKLKGKLEKAEEINSKVQPWTEYDRDVEELDEAKKKAAKLTKEMDGIKTKRLDLLTKAGIPIEGLSFEAGQPLLNELPLDQASGMEQVVFGMEVAMASGCELRAVLVDEGNDLDVKALAKAHKIAQSNGWQLFICRIEAGGPGQEVTVKDGVAK